MSTDIEFEEFKTAAEFGKAISVTAEFGDVVYLEVGVQDACLTPEKARALGWALIRAAASLEWTT